MCPGEEEDLLPCRLRGQAGETLRVPVTPSEEQEGERLVWAAEGGSGVVPTAGAKDSHPKPLRDAARQAGEC